MLSEEQIRQQKIIFVHNETLRFLDLPQNTLLKAFYNKNSFRLKTLAWKKVKNAKKFYEIQMDIDSFKSQDLIKMSKLINDLFYLDLKKARIYTCDKEFANWCKIMAGDINSIRFSE